jgi:hypothetical protein
MNGDGHECNRAESPQVLSLSELSPSRMAERAAPQITVRHQRSIDSVQVTGDARFTADVAAMLGDGRKRRSSTPERPEKSDEHEAAEDKENSPEDSPAGAFARHRLQGTYG